MSLEGLVACVSLDGTLSRSCIFWFPSSHADNNAKTANVPWCHYLWFLWKWHHGGTVSWNHPVPVQSCKKKSGTENQGTRLRCVKLATYIMRVLLNLEWRATWGGMAWEWGATNEWVGVCVCILKQALYQLKLCNTRHFVSTEERFRFPRAAPWLVSVLLWFRLSLKLEAIYIIAVWSFGWTLAL